MVARASIAFNRRYPSALKTGRVSPPWCTCIISLNTYMCLCIWENVWEYLHCTHARLLLAEKNQSNLGCRQCHFSGRVTFWWGQGKRNWQQRERWGLLNWKDTIITTGKGGWCKVVSNDAFGIQVSAPRWNSRRKQGNREIATELEKFLLSFKSQWGKNTHIYIYISSCVVSEYQKKDLAYTSQCCHTEHSYLYSI